MKTISFLLVFLFLPCFSSFAQNTKTEDKKDMFSLQPITNPSIVANYPLNEDFLVKMENIHQGLLLLPPEPAAPGTGNDNSIEGLTASIKGRPKLTALIKENNLEPEDYVIVYLALQAALAAVSSLDDEDAIFDGSIAVSQNNLEFGKQHLNRIRNILYN